MLAFHKYGTDLVAATDQKVSGLNPDGVIESHLLLGGFFVAISGFRRKRTFGESC
jgi:hypothetical protein